MRILHLSDIHVGVENYTRPATEADLAALPEHFAPGVDRSRYLGASTRMLDLLASFDYAVDYALRNGVDLVLFAGDAYKSRDPSQTHQREFASRVARLANGGVPVFLTTGNHDVPHAPNRATALDIFPTLDVPNVAVGHELATHRVDTPAGPAQVVALPWIRTAAFMARDESRGLTMEEISRALEDRLAAMLQAEADALDPALPAFLCAHITVSGAALSSERSLMLGNDHVLLLSTLANPAFDYAALGHVHRHQVLTRNPPVVYSGSLQRVDFSEEGEDKGFCVVEVDAAAPRGERVLGVEFVPVDARPMRTIDAAAAAGQDPTEVTLSAIRRAEGVAGAIVRLRVSMEAADASAFREGAVREALAHAHAVAGIERRVRNPRRTRLGEDGGDSLSPMDALRRYLGTRSLSADREAALVEQAEALLREEREAAGE